jgi:formylmethanofuran dehydrogenase subunit C
LGCVSCAGLDKESRDVENEIILHLKEPTTIPIEADSITPDLFLERTAAQIKKLPVYYGRRKLTLGDLFSVEGERSENIIVRGGLGHVKKIGRKMTRGRIEIQADVGPHTGSYMQGGEILVKGSAGDWAGANMEGGRIRINGNAAHHVGSAYPGDIRGVNRGVIIIDGNAGSELGASMRRGLIVVLGDAGAFAGAGMIAGTILVLGHLGKRAGAGMKRGSIAAFGTNAPLLPTYRFESVFQPVYLRTLIKRLRQWDVPIAARLEEQLFKRYSGDINALGKGEILINA